MTDATSTRDPLEIANELLKQFLAPIADLGLEFRGTASWTMKDGDETVVIASYTNLIANNDGIVADRVEISFPAIARTTEAMVKAQQAFTEHGASAA